MFASVLIQEGHRMALTRRQEAKEMVGDVLRSLVIENLGLSEDPDRESMIFPTDFWDSTQSLGWICNAGGEQAASVSLFGLERG